MYADHARNAFRNRLANCRDAALDDIGVVGYQGRQESRRPECAVRRDHGAQRFDVRRIIEQHAATAIDLDVDEAWRKQAPFQIVERRVPARAFRDEFDNPAIGDDEVLACDDPVTVEDTAVDENLLHAMSTTFPGLRILFGSSVRLSAAINAISADERVIGNQAFFSRPMPCSADIAPANGSRQE